MTWVPKFFTDLSQIRILPGQKTPDPRKSFFENYYNHLHQLGLKSEITAQKFARSNNKLEFAIKEALAHMTIFDALYDGYDYFDVVGQATIVKYLGSAATIGLLALAAIEGAHMLAIKTGYARHDEDNHQNLAILCLLAAATVFAITAIIYVNAVISLVSRPIVTLIHGWKPANEDRFYDQAVEDRNGGILGGAGETIFNILG